MFRSFGRVGLVVNPTAGGRRAAQIGHEVARGLREREIPYVDLSGPTGSAAVEQARAAVLAGAVDRLVVVGGDGMVNLAVHALAGSGVPLVIVPAGTGNDTAMALGVPVGDPGAALDLMLTGATHTVDAARVRGSRGEERWFVGVLAAGFDAVVNERANMMTWPRGRAKYTIAALRELPVFRPIPFQVVIDGVLHDQRAMLVAVANTTSYGGGMKVVPTAVLDDGELDVLLLGEVSTATFLRVFPRVFSGRHVDHPAVRIIRGSRIELRATGIVAYADGERLGPLPRTVEVVPAAMRIVGARMRPGPPER
ncbi:YegS/Rv2252/BmrU family lipid kinase [Nostocoides sp. F2B08]|uniref:YegS/Rv2252/BmrU family lipid kinase n=1 Tax=Nostocoides sp. F2B08 TaxID=2653936 RepID=UPI001262B785|nr:YegS/Rv2252/BmrU family lipid kinase [Tetrasphaera sp. F2B08]KAB7742978.1 YegS/Rv2252/BmrU family lipid kinase [Tetrasphaera sp. F2B08]